MSEARTHRLEAEIQRTLAALIAREVKDPRVGNVTITAVQVAPDMGSARVYFTPFASQAPAEQVAHGLARAASFLRGQLGRRLSLRHAPRLEFVFDATAEGAARLTSLIDRAVAADRAGHGAAGSAAGGEDGEDGEDGGGAGSGGPGSGDPAS